MIIRVAIRSIQLCLSQSTPTCVFISARCLLIQMLSRDSQLSRLKGGRHKSSVLQQRRGRYPYVYWTMHHCYSRRIRDQLDVTIY